MVTFCVVRISIVRIRGIRLHQSPNVSFLLECIQRFGKNLNCLSFAEGELLFPCNKPIYLPRHRKHMRETSFIEQNKQKWGEFEQKFEKESDPEKVSNLFIQVTDDLSYARTYYPNRSVKIYLNNLSQKVFQTIYKNKVRRRRKFQTFWTDELPQKMYDSRWQLLFTFTLFMIAFFIGIFSSMHDPEFARFILGDSYVRMTEENIASGDPMKVYKEMNEFDMFFAITFNNLRVSFLTMIFGIFFGLGTAYFILYNGIMVGVFQYFFIERGLFAESFLTIWVHGALEISAIVIAGTAGITLGRGLLFPGTYTRAQSFRIHGLRAVQIFLGIAPIIVLAGINESFLTRYTETPDIVRALLIILEFGFMLFYFVIYPARKAKKGFAVSRKSDEIPADKIPSINLRKIKTNGEIFADGFSALRLYSGPIMQVVIATTFVYVGIYFWQIMSFTEVFHQIQILRAAAIVESVRDVFMLLNYQEAPTALAGYKLLVLNVISLTIISSLAIYVLQLIKQKNQPFLFSGFGKFLLTKGWFVLLICFGLHSMLLINTTIIRWLFFAALPMVFMLFADISSKGKLSGGIFRKANYYFKQFLNVNLLYMPLLVLSIMMACIAHSLICYFNVELIKWNIPFDPLIYEAIQDISITFILMGVIFLQITMVAINIGLMYFSVKEIEDAEDLQTRVQELAHSKSMVKG